MSPHRPCPIIPAQQPRRTHCTHRAFHALKLNVVEWPTPAGQMDMFACKLRLAASPARLESPNSDTQVGEVLRCRWADLDEGDEPAVKKSKRARTSAAATESRDHVRT